MQPTKRAQMRIDCARLFLTGRPAPIPFFASCSYDQQMKYTTIQQSEFLHTYRVTTSDMNRYNIMHGGRLLNLCDEAGYMAARKHGHCDCLTRAVHQARFHQAIACKEKLSLRARVGLTGHSSLWVWIEVLRADHGQVMMDAVFVYAAIDNHRQLQRVPPIQAVSDEEKQLQTRLTRMRDSFQKQ